jgi:hypothetical protein
MKAFLEDGKQRVRRAGFKPTIGFSLLATIEHSRITVGAVVSFADHSAIVCCAVTGAPRKLPDGSIDTVTIPFLPLGEAAFRATVVSADGTAGVDESFATAFESWHGDGRGLSAFTVPFEGHLDRLIALQMAAIVGEES